MKKLFALLLAMLMVASLAACGAKEEPPVEEPAPEVEEQVAPETEEPAAPEVEEPAEPEVEEPAEPETEEPVEPETEEEMAPAASNSASDILNNIWAATPDEEKFPVAGGDANNMTMDMAGVVELASADYVTNILLVPAEQQANITEIGNMMHMMNQNTFTSGVYKLAEGADAAAFAAAMQERIQGNQWICGFPEQLLIVDLNGYVLVAFGNGDIMTSFAAHTAEAYADSTVLYNEAIG